jgi:hypothetical protein
MCVSESEIRSGHRSLPSWHCWRAMYYEFSGGASQSGEGCAATDNSQNSTELLTPSVLVVPFAGIHFGRDWTLESHRRITCETCGNRFHNSRMPAFDLRSSWQITMMDMAVRMLRAEFYFKHQAMPAWRMLLVEHASSSDRR